MILRLPHSNMGWNYGVSEESCQAKGVGSDSEYYFGSPVDKNCIPATAVPDPSRARIFSRFAPAVTIASDRQRNAASREVPRGSRNIQGMFVEVSRRSVERASTGTKDLVPICSAR